MVCLESDYERSYSKLPETGPNSKMTKSLVVEVVRVTTALVEQKSLKDGQKGQIFTFSTK